MIKTIIQIIILIFFITPSVFALDEERRLEAILIGRLASYVEFPYRPTKFFIITVIDKNPFGNLLDELYKDKLINGKPVEIRYVSKIEDIGMCDIIFITSESAKQRQAIIDYAIKYSILTVSNSRGFAESGGIVQINFVNRKPNIKINYSSAQKSGIKIGAPLLSISTVINTGGS
ncbi:MAG: YfiR family protein [Thermodesulfovibrionales bacterium]|nr:YfiR family protein [Thermodesulfovibrionales bacterium]